MRKALLAYRLSLALLFLVCALFYIWIYLNLSALAWSRAISEPLANNKYHDLYTVKILWFQNSIEVVGLRVPDGENESGNEDVFLYRMILTPQDTSVLEDIFFYRYPMGPILARFQGLEIPSKKLLKELLEEVGDPKANSLVFDGSFVVTVNLHRHIENLKLTSLVELSGSHHFSENRLKSISNSVNHYLPQSQF